MSVEKGKRRALVDDVADTGEETISAISTPRGLGGISIVRMSGPRAIEIADGCVKLVRGGRVERMRNWSAALGRVIDPATGGMVDEVVVLLMKAPRSYTGEDVVELQCHGGPLVAEKILDITLRGGARLAQAGEFTKRAFLNGRMSLEEAEAVMDVVSAGSETSLAHAGLRLKGELGALIGRWKTSILEILAEMEAGIDFPDDLAWEVSDTEKTIETLENIAGDMSKLLSRAPLGLALVNGVEIVLLGRPNVGKSSLFNALLGQERAIVTEIPGTTRDILRERTEWFGIPVVLLDTAGLRSTEEIVEMIGVERAEKAAHEAEVILYVLDDSRGLSDDDVKWLNGFKGKRIVAVINKSDLGLRKVSRSELSELVGDRVVEVSCASGRGIEDLKAKVRSFFEGEGEALGVVLGSARQVDCVRRAKSALEQGINDLRQGWTLDAAVLSLEEAVRALMELTGEKVSEETLNLVFSRFCVGK